MKSIEALEAWRERVFNECVASGMPSDVAQAVVDTAGGPSDVRRAREHAEELRRFVEFHCGGSSRMVAGMLRARMTWPQAQAFMRTAMDRVDPGSTLTTYAISVAEQELAARHLNVH